MSKGLSYSNFSALHRCGRFYKLSVLDKEPQPANVNFEFGSALHAGLHTSLDTKNADAAIDVFQAYWGTSLEKGIEYDTRFPHVVLDGLGVRFVSNFTKRYAVKMEMVVGEQRMYAPWDNVKLEGTPDALVEYEGQNVLLDFKSSAYAYAPDKIDTSLQLLLYAWLLEQNGRRVDAIAYVVFVKGTGAIQTLAPIPYEREKALQLIGEMVSYFKRNELGSERNPNNCFIGKHVCPYFEKCWK